MIALYTSHGGKFPESIRRKCWERICSEDWEDGILAIVPREIATKLEAWAPNRARYIVMECERPGQLDRWSRLSWGLAEICSEIRSASQVCLLEHDVLYPPGYAERRRTTAARLVSFAPAVRLVPEGWATAGQLSSTCCGAPFTLHEIARKRLDSIAEGRRIRWDEPGRNDGDDLERVMDGGHIPAIDIRHGSNMTGARKAKFPLDHKVPFWGSARDMWAEVQPKIAE